MVLLERRQMPHPQRLPNARTVLVLTPAICSSGGTCSWLQGQAVAEAWGLGAQVLAVMTACYLLACE